MRWQNTVERRNEQEGNITQSTAQPNCFITKAIKPPYI
jgi:hypothetical protein